MSPETRDGCYLDIYEQLNDIRRQANSLSKSVAALNVLVREGTGPEYNGDEEVVRADGMVIYIQNATDCIAKNLEILRRG